MAELGKAALRPFRESGYEILDDGLAAYGEVVIWSVSPVVPHAGDSFLIESNGRAYDIAVAELTAFKGGWSARRRVEASL